MKSFSLLGNNHIKEAARRGSFGSAVIFDGVTGSGKKAAAAYAAAALLCRGERDKAPCCTCSSCVQALAGSHPDIIFFNEKGENIKVKDIRELRMKSFIAPSQSPFKVFIINRADLMNQESQNALLKVLEEPKSSVFILLAENAASLLQTVRSRCGIYSMEVFGSDEVAAYLTDFYKEQGRDISRKDILSAADRCGGSIGKAMQLLDDGGSRAAAMAKSFLDALKVSELAIIEACLKASSLSRADYNDFYTETTAGLAERSVSEPQNAGFYVSVYDYIQKQRDKLTDNNASVFALSSQLAAFCGSIYRS